MAVANRASTVVVDGTAQVVKGPVSIKGAIIPASATVTVLRGGTQILQFINGSAAQEIDLPLRSASDLTVTVSSGSVVFLLAQK